MFALKSTLSVTVPAVAIALVLGAGIGDVTYAASSSGKTIHACANKKTGALRLARKCKKSEKKVSWNVKGSAGKRGAPGAPGSARAYASVDETGVIDPTVHSLNVSAVSLRATGQYCVTFASTVPIAANQFAQISAIGVNEALAFNVDAYKTIPGQESATALPCPANSLYVETGTGLVDSPAGKFVNSAFTILLP